MEQVKTDQRTGRSGMMVQVENPLIAWCPEVRPCPENVAEYVL